MSRFLNHIAHLADSGRKQLAILIDPDKFNIDENKITIEQLQYRGITHIFIGGSEVSTSKMQKVVKFVKTKTDLPVIIFPGDPDQICDEADALLFLSLLSGRNPEYLIGKQVEAAPKLLNCDLEIIPTAYLLIDGGSKSSVQRVTETEPLKDPKKILSTALAAQFLGMRMIYLEAGSGAQKPIDRSIISLVNEYVDLPLIVGGGIRSGEQLNAAFENGADLVVMGNIFETQPEVLLEIERVMTSYARNY